MSADFTEVQKVPTKCRKIHFFKYRTKSILCRIFDSVLWQRRIRATARMRADLGVWPRAQEIVSLAPEIDYDMELNTAERWSLSLVISRI